MKKWTKEAFIELANKYENVADFKKDNNGCYQVALKNGWWKNYHWLKKSVKSRLKWTKEKIIDAMRQCVTFGEFWKRFPVAARRAKMLNLINNPKRISNDSDYPILKKALRKSSKYDYDACFSLALKCRTKKEMRQSFSGAYAVARKNKWLDNYHWLKKSSPLSVSEGNRIWVVYVWTFEPSHSAYIGLTRQFNRRVWEEKNRTKETVYKHLLKTHDSYEVNVCVSGLTAAEAQEQEGFFVQYYKDLGYKVINKFKTGLNVSSLGGGIEKWTFEKSKKFAEKCGTYSAFAKASPFAYNMCRYKGWIEKFDIIDDRQKKLSEEECQKVAMQCNSLEEFKEKFSRAYRSAIRYGYNLPWPKKNSIKSLTDEEVKRIAKLYTKLKEFRQNEKKAYTAACRRNLISSFTWLKCDRNRNFILSKEETEKVEDAKKRGLKIRSDRDYIGKSRLQLRKKNERRQEVIDRMSLFKTSYDLFSNDPNTYRAAISLNLLKKKYNQQQECKEAAKKCKNATEFKQKYHLLYMVAQRLRLFKSLEYAEPRHKRKISDEEIKAAVALCKNQKEFRQRFPSEYNTVSKYQLYHLIDCLDIAKKHKDGFWNEKNVFEVSKKCKTFAEFHDKYRGAWAAAKKKDLLKKMIWLTRERSNTLYTLEYIKDLCVKNGIRSMAELYRFNKSAYNAVSKRGYKSDMDVFF
jgi:predicted GIY-YIG superfamily endonuclease